MNIVKFITHECGNSPNHALHRAVELAQANCHNSDGTGTIADRQGSEIMMFELDRSADPIEMLSSCFNTTIRTQEDPIGCIDLKEGEFLFFGWANKDPKEFYDPDR